MATRRNDLFPALLVGIVLLTALVGALVIEQATTPGQETSSIAETPPAAPLLGQAGAGAGGAAMSSFAPSTDPNDASTTTPYLTATSSTDGTIDNLTIAVTATPNTAYQYIYKTGYYSENVASAWVPFNFTNTIAGTNWVKNSASITINNVAGLGSDEYVIVYVCKRYNSTQGVYCGPTNPLNVASKEWTIQPLTRHSSAYSCWNRPGQFCTSQAGNATLNSSGTCQAGQCYSCNPTFTNTSGGCFCGVSLNSCGGVCVNTANNNDTCGPSCTNCTAAGKACQQGVCVTPCTNDPQCVGHNANDRFCQLSVSAGTLYNCTMQGGCLKIGSTGCSANSVCNTTPGTNPPYSWCAPCNQTTPLPSQLSCSSTPTTGLLCNGGAWSVTGTNCTSGTCNAATGTCGTACTSIIGQFCAATQPPNGATATGTCASGTSCYKCNGGYNYNSATGQCECAGCTISNVCYADGTSNQWNTCQTCVKATSATAWTIAADNTACTNNIGLSGACKNGLCSSSDGCALSCGSGGGCTLACTTTSGCTPDPDCVFACSSTATGTLSCSGCAGKTNLITLSIPELGAGQNAQFKMCCPHADDCAEFWNAPYGTNTAQCRVKGSTETVSSQTYVCSPDGHINDWVKCGGTGQPSCSGVGTPTCRYNDTTPLSGFACSSTGCVGTNVIVARWNADSRNTITNKINLDGTIQYFDSCCASATSCADNSGACIAQGTFLNPAPAGNQWYLCTKDTSGPYVAVCGVNTYGAGDYSMTADGTTYYCTRTGSSSSYTYAWSTTVGVAAYSAPTTASGGSFSLRITDGPANTNGDLMQSFDNGATFILQAGNWLTTDANGAASKGPWTCTGAKTDIIYIAWHGGKGATTQTTHVCQ